MYKLHRWFLCWLSLVTTVIPSFMHYYLLYSTGAMFFYGLKVRSSTSKRIMTCFIAVVCNHTCNVFEVCPAAVTCKFHSRCLCNPNDKYDFLRSCVWQDQAERTSRTPGRCTCLSSSCLASYVIVILTP